MEVYTKVCKRFSPRLVTHITKPIRNELSWASNNTKLREVLKFSNNHVYEDIINYRSYTYNLSLKSNLGLNDSMSSACHVHASAIPV